MKLLLVEDENKTRSALRECIPWHELGITDVIEASDGRQALELVRDDPPHIVITDIRMPGMDGIELARSLTECCGDVQIIIISAYVDVGYYQSAIRLGTVDYVLKPVDIPSLIRAVNKAVGKHRDYESRQRMKRLMDDHSDILREVILKRILNRTEFQPGRWTEEMQLLGLPSDGRLAFMVIHMSGRFADGKPMAEYQQSVRETVAARGDAFALRELFLYRSELILILGWDEDRESAAQAVEELLLAIRLRIQRLCPIRAAVGQGTVVKDLNGLYGSYQASLRAGGDGDGERDAGISRKKLSVVGSIKQTIARRYFDGSLTVKDIADEMYYTSAYICMIFKEITGETINHYLNLYRVEQAKLLLRDISLSLCDVSSMVGYQQIGYFSKVFKKLTGVTPSEYRCAAMGHEAQDS